MTEEDEAFNEIERQAKQRMEAVKYAHKAYSMSISTTGEELSKLLTESYDAGVKDALESATQAIQELRTWVGLTDEEIAMWRPRFKFSEALIREVEAKLKEKNT